MTGADSAEMGQGGMRVNMVPKDGGNSFHGVAVRQLHAVGWASDNCGSPGVGQPCTRSNLTGDTTFNTTNNFLTNVSQLTKNYDFNPGVGGPIARDKVWFYATFRYLGVNKTVADSFFDADPSPFRYVADTSRPGIDDGHIRSIAGRVAAQVSQKDKISYYHDEQDKVRGHWGIASTVPPEASAIQATPTSFVSVIEMDADAEQQAAARRRSRASTTRSTRRTISRRSSPAPVRSSRIIDNSTGKIASAWNNPADHFSKLFTEQFAASYVTGSHSLRFGATISQAKWRLTQQFTGDVAAGQLQRRRANGTQSGQRHAAHSDRSPQLDQERQRRVRAGQVDVQARHGQRRLPLGLVHQRDRPGNASSQHVEQRGHLQRVFRRQEQPQRRLHRTG